MVSGIIVLAILAGLGSLAYPSIPATSYSTETIVKSGLNVKISGYVYPYTISTWSNSHVTTVQAQFIGGGACWGTGNDIGGGCGYLYYFTNTYQIPMQYTVTYTSTSQLTLSNQWTSTNELTHLFTQKMPLYASFGLNDTGFMIVAVLIIVMGAIAIVYSCRRIFSPQQAKLT